LSATFFLTLLLVVLHYPPSSTSRRLVKLHDWVWLLGLVNLRLLLP
jgi:hypothetical protein